MASLHQESLLPWNKNPQIQFLALNFFYLLLEFKVLPIFSFLQLQYYFCVC